jgi:hypothetical protein
MFLATYCDENRIREQAARLGVTIDFLAALARIRSATLGAALRGVKPLDRNTADQVLTQLAELEGLTRAFGVVPLALVNPDAIRQLLDRKRQNDISNEKIATVMAELFGEL